MRERIGTELSDEFCKKVLLPGIVHDYEVGFEEMILLNKAYAIMLEECKIIEKEDAKSILEGLDFAGQTLKPEELSGKCEDLYFNMEKRMMQKTGKVGGKLHAGRSRNDIHATIGRMEIRKTVWGVLDGLIALQSALLEKAQENKDAVLTGYTHCQPGQPITLAHYYSALHNALARDFGRIKNAYENVNLSPYGVAAFAGSSFPVDRQRLADLLGFDAVMENSLDCIASKDYVAELLSAYAILSVNISRAAEDLYFWATFENGILEISGEIAICSSIMPQKKNPVSLEYSKSKAAHLIGAAMSSLTALKSAPFTNNMDIFEAPALYWEGVRQLMQQFCCMTETVQCARLRKEVATRKASENFCTVTSLADELVKHHGISFTEAHHIVGNIVARVIEEKTYMRGITPELLKKETEAVLGRAIEMDEAQLHKVLDPLENVESKQGVGGPSAASVTAMLDNARHGLRAQEAWLDKARLEVRKAYEEIAKAQANLCE